MATLRPLRDESRLTAMGPLAGLLVVDMAQMLAAPFSAMLLADFGATVLKIEPPGGDATRRIGPQVNGISVWWRLLGRNKYSVTLNLKRSEGRELMLRLLAGADVLVENMRPGKLEALGLGPAELHARNRGLVILRVTGWGQTGPYRDRAAFGTQAEAMSGFAYGNGDRDGPPTLTSFPLADGAAGYLGAYAVMAALWRREHDPERRGQVIDLSLFEALFGLLGPQATTYDKLGTVTERLGNRSPTAIPRGIYQTRDQRWVAVSCATEQIVARTFMAVDRPELCSDPRYGSLTSRLERVDELDAIMQEWIGRHDLDVVIRRFTEAEATVAPVTTIREILEDPHFQARETVVTVETRDVGSMKIQNVFPRLEATPGHVRWPGRETPGIDNDVWLDRLGLSSAELARLRHEGII